MIKCCSLVKANTILRQHQILKYDKVTRIVPVVLASNKKSSDFCSLLLVDFFLYKEVREYIKIIGKTSRESGFLLEYFQGCKIDCYVNLYRYG